MLATNTPATAVLLADAAYIAQSTGNEDRPGRETAESALSFALRAALDAHMPDARIELDFDTLPQAQRFLGHFEHADAFDAAVDVVTII
mgnify:CR=1 FL=1